MRPHGGLVPPPRAALTESLHFALPLSFTDWGLNFELSMIVRVAVNVPGAVGLNVTPIVHFPPGGSGELQPSSTLNGATAPLTPSINTGEPDFFLGLLTVIFAGPF
jgi:hypothetical protein